MPRNAKNNPPTYKITWKLSCSNTYWILGGSNIKITPVIIPAITIPENLVIKSPIQGHKNFILNNPPIIKPIPANISPYATKNHTDIGKLNPSASSTFNGNLLKPCCIKTIANGILSSQLEP